MLEPRTDLSLRRGLMDYEPTNRRKLLWAIVAALVAWSALLTLGAFLGLDPQTPDRDYRRLLIVLGVTGGFLAFWLTLLLWRGKR